jgi:uncharacterized protein (DUF2236 family)
VTGRPSRPALLEPVRAHIARAVRSRVAGSDDGRAERIWRTPGPRWFRPGDPIWRVHSDPSMMVGGLRALLVQSLHPLAMAGVAGHSGFKGDPWGRLQRTSLFIAMTTYAPIPDAEALLARIRGIHRRVSGVSDDGSPYAASDPHLLAWVHAAEAQSFLTAFQTYAARPLSPADADRYVAQVGSVSSRLGVVSPPQTVADLDAVIAAYGDELRASPAALEAAEFLLHEPPLTGAARVGYRPFALGAVAITPSWVREELGLGAGSYRSNSLGMQLCAATLRTLRWAIDHPADQPLPEGWSHQPFGHEPGLRPATPASRRSAP